MGVMKIDIDENGYYILPPFTKGLGRLFIWYLIFFAIVFIILYILS